MWSSFRSCLARIVGLATVSAALVVAPVTTSPRAEAAASPGGYWLMTASGSISGFGTASPSFGLPSPLSLNRPIVGAALTPGARGMWLVGADGGVFAAGGNAGFFGSAVGLRLAAPTSQ